MPADTRDPEDLSERVVMADTKSLTVTVEEAAEVLGISRTLAYELVARGELPHLRLGRQRVLQARRRAGSVQRRSRLFRRGGASMLLCGTSPV